jgi:RsmE family RNA methyltransferase
MNIILINPSDFIASNKVLLNDRRFQHILTVHKATVGNTLKVGLIDGKRGSAQVLEIDNNCVTLQTNLNLPALQALPLTLILALPRPKMLKRILQSTASLGVKEIHLINSYRVEKSYWSSPVLTDHSIQEHLLLGLEQAGDTILPKVHLCKRFKPFVEDQLPTIAANSRKIVAHPYKAKPIDSQKDSTFKNTVLAIGPEGGFIDYEIDKLIQLDFEPLSLGDRILRVETAIPYCLAKLFS